MTGVILMPLTLYFVSRDSLKECLKKSIPFLTLVLLFQLQKYAMLGTLSGMPPHDLVNYPYAEAKAKLPSTFLIFLWCLRLVWFPHPLSYDYSYNQIPAASFSSPFVILGILLAVALGYFSFRRPLKRSPIVFGMQVFCVTLAPAMAFVLLRGGTIELSFQRTSRLPRIAVRRGGIMEASSSI